MKIFDLDSWQEIWSTISKNKVRSFLTAFGVFWGIYMLLILIGVGNGLSSGMYKNVSGFATNSSFYFANKTGEPYMGYRKGRQWNIQNRDLELIRSKSKTVEHISPMNFAGGAGKNVVNGMKSGSFGVRGIYPAFFEVQKQYLLEGRLFNNFDISEKKKVCIIGKTVAETIFDKGEDPIGKYIRVNGLYFQVVGVISPKSNVEMGGSVDESILLPFSTMQSLFSKSDVIHFLSLTTKPGYPVSATQDEVTRIIKESHSIAPNDEKALRSVNLEKEFEIFNNLFLGINTIIWIVGLGALLSGIIGISNIMVVTIKERTREIGVRRALGAKPMTIMVQILSESFVLTAIAGLVGFLFAIGTLTLVEKTIFENMPPGHTIFDAPFVTFKVAIYALIILVISGILAGILPASRALKVSAIDAIRDE